MTRALAAILALVLAPMVLADGVMFRNEEVGRSGALVSSPRQEALLITDGQTIQVVLRTHFARGPADVAWFIPVPAPPTDVAAAKDAILDDLDDLTAPRFYRRVQGSGAFGCGCSAPGEVGEELQPPVALVSSGTAGVYEYVTLTATRTDELTRWLRERKYSVPPGAEAAFAPYVAAKWHWLALRVRPEKATKPRLAPHPVRYRYTADNLVYPMVISSPSAAAESEILLFVLADRRYECANWANATLEPEQLRGLHRPEQYATVLADTSRRQSHLFVTEYAGKIDGIPAGRRALAGWDGPDLVYLTRMRAMPSPVSMDRDVQLMPAAKQQDVSNIHWLSAQYESVSAALLVSAAVAIAGLCLLRFGGRRRRVIAAQGR